MIKKASLLITILMFINNFVLASEQDDLTSFTDVKSESGIYSTGNLGHSAIWSDYNNDDCLDLLMTNTDRRKRKNVYVFTNLCNGKFETQQGFLDIKLENPIRSVSWADFNNDGFQDLIVGTINVKNSPRLFQNIGDDKLIDITERALIDKPGLIMTTQWVDFDNDGNLDISQIGNKFYLYSNQNNGSFDEISEDVGLIDITHSRSSLWFDYNNDGFQDLFITKDGTNKFYMNSKGKKFIEITSETGLEGDKSWRSESACAGDINNDSYTDLYVLNIGSNRNALYLNNGDGTFTDITYRSKTHDVGDGRTCSFIDHNSDGLIDIFSTNHINPNKMFVNLGNKKFEDKARSLNIEQPMDIFSASWGDYNGDAILDVILNGHLGTALYEGFNTNNSVVIELVGDGNTTNTSAIGSKAELKTESKNQIRHVIGGKGCCENDMLPLHFGLGLESEFSLTVTWTSGDKCNFTDLNAYDKRNYKVYQEDCRIYSH